VNVAVTFEELRRLALQAIRLRVANGYFSERQLARLARLSQPQVHNVLKGKRAASFRTIDRLCAAAAVDIAEIARSGRSSEPEEAWWKIAA